MENVRSTMYSLISRRFWLFSGLLALLIALLLGLMTLLLPPTFQAHAASVQGCQITTAKTGGAYGLGSTTSVRSTAGLSTAPIGSTTGQECIMTTGGRITTGQGGICTANVEGQKTTVSCVISRKQP